MNTKQIQNVLLGSTPVNSVYKGENLVWTQNTETGWLYKPTDLVSLYDKNNFVEGSPWTDKITQSSVNLSDAALSKCYAATIEKSVRLASGTANFPVKTDTGLSSAYIRFRISSARQNTTTFFKAYTSNYYGFSFYYEKGEIYLCKHSGSSTPYEKKELSVDAHFYNTYGFICDGRILKLYINGNYTDETAVDGMYSKFVYIANEDSDIAVALEIIAMYDTLHSDSEAVLATRPINSRYKATVPDPSNGVMLYDHGNLCEEITGGWITNPYSQYSSTICEFADDCIKLNGVNASTSYYVSVQTKNHLDLSKYSYIYYLISPSVHPGELKYNSNYMGTRCGYTTATSATSTSGRTMTTYTIGGLSGKNSGEEKDAFLVFVNISKVNNSQAVIIADGSGLTNGKSAKIYSVWME